MEKVKALLESAETQSMLQENIELVEAATNDLCQFYGILNKYIQENLVDFLDDSLEETSKNIILRYFQ